MNTAVTLRSTDDFATALVLGTPLATTASEMGEIAVFPPGQVVGVMLETARRTRVFVFRTLAEPTVTGARVPGVHPVVSLLFDTRSRTAAAGFRNLLLYLSRHGRDPQSLSDDFYVRVGVALNGRGRATRELAAAVVDHEQK